MYENGNILRHCLQTLYNFMLFCILVHNNGIKNKKKKADKFQNSNVFQENNEDFLFFMLFSPKSSNVIDSKYNTP